MSKKKLLFVTLYERAEQKKEFEIKMKDSFLEKGKRDVCLNFSHSEPVEKIIQITKKKKPEEIIFDTALLVEEVKKISAKLHKSLNGKTPRLTHSISLKSVLSLSEA